MVEKLLLQLFQEFWNMIFNLYFADLGVAVWFGINGFSIVCVNCMINRVTEEYMFSFQVKFVIKIKAKFFN